MVSPLANPTYRVLFAAQVIALFGSGFTTVALVLLAHDLSGGRAGEILGTALALKMVAYVGVAPTATAFAQRVSWKRLLVGLNTGRAAIVLLLPLVDAVWQIYVLIFLLSMFTAGFTPSVQALIPEVLPDERQYTRALSLSRLAHDIENLVSPMAAAAVLTVLHFNALFVLNGAAFIISSLLILVISFSPLRREELEAKPFQVLIQGLTIYLKTPRLRGLFLLSLSSAAAGAMIIVNTVVYVRTVLGGSQSDVALAFAATGAGSMAGALLLPKLLDRMPERPVMLAGGALMFVGLTLGIALPGFILLLPVWFLIGVGSSAILTPAGRLLRRSCREEDRASVFASQFSLAHACWLITYPLAGWAGSAWGIGNAFAFLAGIAFLSTLAAGLAWRPDTAAELEHAHRATKHEHPHYHDEHHEHEHEDGDSKEPHRHQHRHEPLRHSHSFVIDYHHHEWP